MHGWTHCKIAVVYNGRPTELSHDGGRRGRRVDPHSFHLDIRLERTVRSHAAGRERDNGILSLRRNVLSLHAWVLLYRLLHPRRSRRDIHLHPSPARYSACSIMKLKTLRRSHNPAKKWDAIFELPNGKTKTVPFGARGMSDYTKHKDKTRRARYLKRHSGMGEHWRRPDTPGALSRWVLWNKPSLKASLSDFKRKFGV